VCTRCRRSPGSPPDVMNDLQAEDVLERIEVTIAVQRCMPVDEAERRDELGSLEAGSRVRPTRDSAKALSPDPIRCDTAAVAPSSMIPRRYLVHARAAADRSGMSSGSRPRLGSV
jgi:hypothetical protein